MGIVLRAVDEKLQRVVAVKVLAPQLAASGAARKRFVREARAAAAVTHDNVIAIHAVEDEGLVPYLVMQFVDGETLQEKLDRLGPLSLRETLRIGLQIADGLAAAHRQGLVHRDIKPANILLENGIERVKITDFGLARAVDDASLSQSGIIAGTPAFMSPEQASGDPVDHRSDLFSLGSVLYSLCAGHPPFRAATTVATLKRVCEETARPLREVNPDIPQWLDSLIAELHAKNPAERFDSASEVATLLSKRLTQLQTGAPADELEPAVMTRNNSAQVTSARSHGQRLLTASRLAVAVVVIASVWWGWQFLPNKPGSSPNVTDVAGRDVRQNLGDSTSGDVPRSGEYGDGSDLTDDAGRKPTILETNKPAVPAPLPNPLDGRRREDIAPDLLKLAGDGDSEKAPAEVVAVFGNNIGVTSVAISPDGRFVACGGNDWAVSLWDLGDWKAGSDTPPHQVLKGHNHNVWSVAFSPDGKCLASASFDGSIILWDVVTGQNTGTLLGHSRWHSLMAFSPDGKTIASGGDDGTIRHWDVTTQQRLDSWRFHEGIVRAVAFNPDGGRLASAGEDGTVQIIEAASGKRLRFFRHDGKRNSVAFSPDGKLVAATSDIPPGPSARIWDVETGNEQTVLEGHSVHVSDVAFQPRGTLLATGSWDGTARVWNLSAGTSQVLRFGTENGSATRVAIAWSSDGQYLAAAREGQLVCVFRITPLTR
jgi:WD40 repeat protein/serine/threonine protein kinase